MTKAGKMRFKLRAWGQQRGWKVGDTGLDTEGLR